MSQTSVRNAGAPRLSTALHVYDSTRCGLAQAARRVAMVLPIAVLAACASPGADLPGAMPETGPSGGGADDGGAPTGVAAGHAGDTAPIPLEVVTRPEEQLLILEMRLRQFVVSDGIFGYLDDGGLILPLGDYARALEFPIGVDTANGRADGWFLDEDRLFALDLTKAEVVIDGRPRRYNPQLVELHQDDIYVDTRLLAQWFPADIRFDLSNLMVQLQSREPLPIEQRLERERRRGAALHRRQVTTTDYPEIEVPYRWISWPFINVSSEAGYSDNGLGTDNVSARYNLLATADLAKMDTSLFVAGEDGQGVSQIRLEMGRRDPDGELLGPLQVTSYSFGDITTPSVDLIAGSGFGRGAQISSFPLDRTGEFDSTTLIGELPLGWEVELYRNEVLLDFRTSRADGRYEFSDVQLLFGTNVLRLKFFGPQGQRREEVRRIVVGPGQVPPGKLNFRIAANQKDEPLITIEDDSTGTSATQGEARLISGLEYGLNRSTSLAFGAGSLPLESGRRNYGGLGLRMGFSSVFSRFDVIADDAGGVAGRAGLQISLPLNFDIVLDHSELNDFVSEEFPDGTDPVVRVSDARIDGVIPGGSLFRVPFSISASREETESGTTSTVIGNRLSTSISRVSLSNTLEWQDISGPTTNASTATGSFLAAGRIGPTTMRGDLRYDIEPESQVTSSSLSLERQFDTDLRGRLAVEKRFTGNETTTYSARLTNRFDLASVGISGEWTDDGSWSTLLTLSFSVGREPRSGDWQMSSRNMADNGSVSGRVFLDNDLDGEFSEGDTAIEGARFTAGRSTGKEETNEDGVAFVTGLQTDRHTDFAISGRSLIDPYWVSEPAGYSVVPRPGVAAVIDFPLVVTGEIDGMVYVAEGGNVYELADVALQLRALDGRLVAETKSAFDGFYLFEFVRPGDYTVQVDPDQLRRLGYVSTGAKKVTIEGEGTIASGVEFTLAPASGN